MQRYIATVVTVIRLIDTDSYKLETRRVLYTTHSVKIRPKMVLNMKKILEDMGWSDGYHIPVANKENLNLEAEVERLTIAKAKASTISEALTAKCTALDRHMKNVLTEQEQNQNLIMARHSELEAEKNMYILTKMEKDRLSSDIKTVNKELEKIESRKQAKQSELSSLVEKLDKLKISVEWDEQTLENWEEMLLKKHEDNDVIQKFSKEDQKKAKDLELKRQRLQEEETMKRQLIARTSTELDSMELILVRNVQLFKQMHDERSSLVRQWQEAVRHLQERDKDTLALNREIISTKELNDTKLENLEQEKQFYANEVNNNKELEIQIEISNAEVAKVRKDLSNCVQLTQECTVELDALKRELKKTAHMLENERAAVKRMNEEWRQKNRHMQDIMLKVEDLKVQEKSVTNSSLTSSERTKALEEIIRTEESIYKGLLTDLENLQGSVFRAQKTLNELMDISKLKTLAAQGHEQGLHLLERQKQQAEKDLIIQKETMYKLDYRLAMLKAKLTRVTGDDVDDYSEVHENKLKELEAKCTEVIGINNLLQAQINRLEEVMRNVTNFITIDNGKLDHMRDKLQDQILLVEGAIKQVEQNKNLNQQYQVEENVLKVKLKHNERIQQQEGSTIYNLKKQQIELENIMRERESEIEINKGILVVKKNSLNEDHNRLKLDIQGRRLKIERLKKRLDCVVATMGKTEDGEAVSVAYFKVKNAQEKYMLQEEGDKLDQQIKKAEKEIIAMENTLKAVNLTNDTFKKSLSVVDENGDELTEMQELENVIYSQTKILRKNRNYLLAQQEKLQELQKVIESIATRIESLEKVVSEKEYDLGLLENEAKHRRERIDRADTQIKKLLSTKHVDERRQKDFVTHHLLNCNKNALQQLSEIICTHMETKPTINRYLSEHNLSLTVSSLHTTSRSCSSLSRNSTRSSTSSSSIPSVTLTFGGQK